MFSTPMLGNLCQLSEQPRNIISFEDDFKHFQKQRLAWDSETNNVYYVPKGDWSWVWNRLPEEIGLAFVDHGNIKVDPSGKTRIEALEALRPKAKAIVVHDTNFEWFENAPKFAACLTDKTCEPWTSLLSDDVSVVNKVNNSLRWEAQLHVRIGDADPPKETS